MMFCKSIKLDVSGLYTGLCTTWLILLPFGNGAIISHVCSFNRMKRVGGAGAGEGEKVTMF